MKSTAIRPSGGSIRTTSAPWGKRANREDCSLIAVREAGLNALIHLDYNLYTEGMPIQILLFKDHFEVRSSGGPYGRLRIDQPEKTQLDTCSPVSVMEGWKTAIPAFPPYGGS